MVSTGVMVEWQLINTAPKDGFGTGGRVRGPRIMLFFEGGYIEIGFWNGHSWDDGDFHDDLGEPTHWMLLPEPPK